MKTCIQCDTGFQITSADEKIHQKMSVPAPTHCPDCRQRRRLSFRNDSNYYRNTCHLCQKSLISIYSPDKNIPVLCTDCYWSDNFDPLQYGQEFYFNRPFFEQYAEMKAKVPRLAIFNTQSENAEFTVHSSKNRNCYMGSSLVDCEDVYYTDWAMKSRDCMDLFMCTGMEMCYQCLDCRECSLSNYLELCNNTTESFFAFDCNGCNYVVGCVGLRNRKNHILNQPASKEECIATVHKLKTDSAFFEEFKKKYQALKTGRPVRDAWMTNTENCSGNYVMDSKNAHFAFNSRNLEDCSYVYDIIDAKDAYDCTRNSGVEMLYECKGIVDLKFGKFCNLTYQCDNMVYCDNSQLSSYCFGGMSLKRNQYCILNKQYSEADYNALASKIIGHMKKTGEYGEFFPVTLSPFGYNETKAAEYFPISKEEALARGWKWCDYEAPAPDIQSVPCSRLPDNITDVPDDILNWGIECRETGKPFRIIKKELEFYRKKGLPIPRFSPQARHRGRVEQHNPRRLYARQCENCQTHIQTTYAPDRPEKVVCEECYLKAVY